MTIVGPIGIAAGSFILSMMPTTLGIAGYVAPIVVISSLGTAYSLASMVFGGSPPFIVTWLIAQTGNLRIPGIMAQTPETSAWR